MRFIGLDVHRDFCEVAIAEAGVVRLAGRVQTEPAALTLFAQSLGGDDEVALEATGNALEIARIIEPHVGRVVLANPKAVKGITRAGAKTDKIDARTLAQLLAGGFLPAVWLPDEQTRVLRRRISARAQLVRQRTRAKNQVHATLVRNLKGKPPVSDLFGARGRRWLAAQELPADEQETVAACLRQIVFLDGEIALLERALAEQVLASAEMRDRRDRPLPERAPAGQLPRPRPARQPVRQRAGPTRPHLQAGAGRDAACARRGGLARQPHTGALARLPPADRRPSRRQHRNGGGRTQARRDRLAHAQPRRGLRLRSSLAHPREDPQARCRTGARILWAVKRPSSAAGDSPTSCALARGHPRPTGTLAKEPPPVQRLDLHP